MRVVDRMLEQKRVRLAGHHKRVGRHSLAEALEPGSHMWEQAVHRGQQAGDQAVEVEHYHQSRRLEQHNLSFSSSAALSQVVEPVEEHHMLDLERIEAAEHTDPEEDIRLVAPT